MKASRSQLRMLHLVADGSLTFHSWPRSRFEVRVKEGMDQGWLFHEATAKVLIEREWVTMRGMNSRFGDSVAQYEITDLGCELINEICSKWVRHLNGRDLLNTHRRQRFRPLWQDAHELFAGKMLCRDCGRLVPCVSKKQTQHPAHEWHWYFGPVCHEHLNWIQSQRFIKRRA